MKKNIVSWASKIMLVLAFCLVAPLAYAEEATTVEDSASVLVESSVIASEPEVLEGVTIEEPKSIPSGFGVWWKNFSESVSLGLTFNSVKKAEKQLKFAEERTKLAEFMLSNSTDPKVQEKAQKMIDKANEYTKKLEEKKAEFASKKDERSEKLLENITKHYLNKEKALEKMEDKIPADKLEQFAQMRKNMEADAKVFLENLKNNSDIPQELRDKVADRVLKMENIKSQRIEIRSEQKELLSDLKKGNEEARAELEKLRKERLQETDKMREEFKVKKEEIINKIQSGDKGAVLELKKINKEQAQKAQEVKKEILQKEMELKKERAQKAKEVQKQIKENKPMPNIEGVKPQVDPAPIRIDLTLPQ